MPRHAVKPSPANPTPQKPRIMKSIPIITPARDYSTRNRKRHTVLRRRVLFAGLIIASTLFWACLAIHFFA